MMSMIIWGEIKPERLTTWYSNSDPFDILCENSEIHKLGGWDFLFAAKNIFTEETKVDWGSFAFRCTKEQLETLIQKNHCTIDGLENMKENAAYGIIFIELY